MARSFQRGSPVFCPVQDPRRHAAADQFPDRLGSSRRHPAGDALCIPRPQALAAAVAVMLAICAFSPLGNLLLYPLELRFPPWDPRAARPTASSCSAARSTPICRRRTARRSSRSAADRLFARGGARAPLSEHAHCFHRGHREPGFEGFPGGRLLRPILEISGIAKQRLILERLPQHLRECHLHQSNWWRPRPGERWLLVTSAFHMPRSMGLSARRDLTSKPIRGLANGRP